MIKKILHSFIFYLGIALIVLISAFVIVLHSSWGKKTALEKIQALAKQADMQINAASLKITLPLNYELKNVTITFPTKETLNIQQLRLKISLLPLLQKKIKINKCYADGVSFSFSPHQPLNTPSDSHPFDDSFVSIPYLVSISSLEINNLSFDQLLLHIQGSVEIGQGKIFCHLKTSLQKSPENFFQIFVDGKKNKLLKTNLSAHLTSTKILEPYFPHLKDVPISASIRANGPWNTYLAQIHPLNNSLSPIEGKISVSSMGWDLKAPFQLTATRTLSMQDFLIQNDYLSGKGSLLLHDFVLQQAHLNFEGKNIDQLGRSLSLPLSGRIGGKIKIHKKPSAYEYTATLKATPLSIGSYLLEDMITEAKGTFDKNMLKGNIALSTYFFNEPLKLHCSLDYTYKKDAHISAMQITAPQLKAQGDYTIHPSALIEGKTHLRIENVNTFFPQIGLHSTMQAFIELVAPDNEQSIKMSATLEDFHLGSFFGDNISFTSKLKTPFTKPSGYIYLSIDNAYFKEIFLEKIDAISSINGEKWPYQLEVTGKWNHPLQLLASGWWQYAKNNKQISVEKLLGTMFSHELKTNKPLQFSANDTNISLNNLDLQLDSAQLLANLDYSAKKTTLQLHLEQMPASFLSLVLLDAGARGTLSTDLQLQKEKNDLEGQMHISFDDIEIDLLDNHPPLTIGGTVSSNIDNRNLHLQGNLQFRDNEFLHLDGKIPVHLDFSPFAISFPKKPIASSLAFHGEIGEIAELFNTGIHKISGYTKCDLSISGTYDKPLFNGKCSIEHGMYKNYALGIDLQDIDLLMLFERDLLKLQSFSARDEKEGKLQAYGSMSLNPLDQFPYFLQSQFNQFTILDSSMVLANATGEMRLTGTSKKALLEGKVILEDSIISIPETLPSSIPILDVTFMENGKEIPPAKKEPTISYPIDFNLHLLAPKNLMIQGQGIHSSWQGDLRVIGSLQDPIYLGKLSLERGEFNFSGKYFNLINGAVTFSGLPHVLPQLMITATVTQKGVQIFADLKGPLDNLDLTFRSTPPLPMNAILSLLIFGQDVSEISSLQALQLAASLASYGKGPGALEKAQKSLGIDRLAIVSSPTTADEPDQIAVQIGKYISRDILVSFSQGTTQGSSNVIVEIDLKNGFSFQMETQQQEEQAKFSLKWSRNF